MKMSIKGIEKTFESIKVEMEGLQLKDLQRVSKLLIDDLKKDTPVDTGLASNSWSMETRKSSVVVSNDVAYIKHLNEGSSRQAPAHFVERAALKYGTPLGAITESTN